MDREACVRIKRLSRFYDYLDGEDSENGIRASAGAHLKTIITVNHYTKDHDFTGAVIVLDHMGEPGNSFKVLCGNGFGHTYLNLELIKKLHQNYDERRN